MTEFNSLMDGLHYITTCPLCRGRVTFFGDITMISHGYNGGSKLTIEVDRNKIHVDPLTGSILSVELPDDEEVLGRIPRSLGSPLVVKKVHWKLPTRGLFFTPVRKRCQDCNRYHMTLQVQFDMNRRRIEKVLFNSEHIVVKDGEREFEISNIYTTQETEFTTFGERQSFTRLPLIPLDHKKVKDFVKRVKNLIIFS